MAETEMALANDGTATAVEIAPTSLGNAALDSYYQSFLKTLPNQQISYDPIEYERRSVETLTEQVSKYLRNYYDQSIDARKQQTLQNNAATDVDAYGRNMGESTFLSDLKGRQAQAEAADIANINSNYNAALAQAVQEQYNQDTSNWLNVQSTNRGNQIEVDEWNAAARIALEELAYTRAVQAKANAPVASTYSGGGYSKPKTSSTSTAKEPTEVIIGNLPYPVSPAAAAETAAWIASNSTVVGARR